MDTDSTYDQRTLGAIRGRWPSVARFVAEEGVVVPAGPGAWSDWRFAHHVFWERPGGDAFIAEYERLLDFGYRTGALTKGQRSRLLSRELYNCGGVWGELRAACWFDGAGFLIEQWEPPARGGGKGEFLMRKGTLQLFVEVKAFLGGKAYQDLHSARDSVARDVARWLRRYPGLSFVVDVSLAGFSMMSMTVLSLSR